MSESEFFQFGKESLTQPPPRPPDDPMTEIEASGRGGEDYQRALETVLVNLQKLRAKNQTMHLQVTQLGNQMLALQHEAAPPVPGPRVKTPVGLPLCYSGKKEQFGTFIPQCEHNTHVRQSDFPNDSLKVAFVISLLEALERC